MEQQLGVLDLKKKTTVQCPPTREGDRLPAENAAALHLLSPRVLQPEAETDDIWGACPDMELGPLGFLSKTSPKKVGTFKKHPVPEIENQEVRGQKWPSKLGFHDPSGIKTRCIYIYIYRGKLNIQREEESQELYISQCGGVLCMEVAGSR